MSVSLTGRPGERVLLVWGDLGQCSDHLQAGVAQLQQMVGPGGRVAVENAERLSMAGYAASSFDRIFSGCAGLMTVDHSSLETVAGLHALLAPGGSLTITQAAASPDKVRSSLVMAGLTQATTPEPVPPGAEGLEETRAKLGLDDGSSVNIYTCTATKPTFEIGASRTLSFAKKPSVPAPAPAPLPPAGGSSLWTLEDLDDDTVELVDDEALLDAADQVKPDPASLRVCGTTGKRKACKDCSCGLREELSEGKEPTTRSFTSSCGSCYLGDAFRCASCPYLGMPAFKPGEKIQLSDRQLNPDLRG